MRLYVCNLAWEATVEDLKKWLVDTYAYTIGDVTIPAHPETGRPRGFGFVDLPLDDQGNDALTRLEGAEFMGRPLKVNVAVKRKGSSNRRPSPRRDSRREESDRRDEDLGPRGRGRRNDWGW